MSGCKQLLAPDPLLTKRDLLLDESVIARALAERLGANGPLDIGRLERVAAKYRVGESLRLAHRVEVEGTETLVGSRTFREGRSTLAFESLVARAAPDGRLRSVVHVPELDTVFWTFPTDRKIGTLASLERLPEEVRRELGGRWSRSVVIRYIPEKRATATCLTDAGDVIAFAKVYESDEGERATEKLELLRRALPPDDPHLRLPRTIGYSPAHKLLVVDVLPGARLTELGRRTLRAGVSRLGEALAKLHTLPSPGGEGLDRVGPGELRTAAATVGSALPRVASLAGELADRLEETRSPAEDPDVCLHGDLNLGNVIVGDDHIALIDLDLASSGPAAAELGALLARLRVRRLTGELAPGALRDLTAALLGGYARVSRLPAPVELHWNTAAALLGDRALGAIKQLHAHEIARVEQMLLEAHGLLAEAA